MHGCEENTVALAEIGAKVACFSTRNTNVHRIRKFLQAGYIFVFYNISQPNLLMYNNSLEIHQFEFYLEETRINEHTQPQFTF